MLGRSSVGGGATIDISTFHRLWSGLPGGSVDKAFWSSLEQFCDVFLNGNDCMFTNQEFFSVPHTGRLEQDEIHIIDSSLTRQVNEMRALYDIFTLWNPIAISSLLKINVSTVIEQLLLAVYQQWISLQFVVCCESCACDIVHRDAVNKYQFTGTYHVTNAFRCPVCSDRVEVSELKNVQVFFQLTRLPSCYQRLHHRQCLTELAKERRLETFFCPAGAGFAFRAHLPRGQYLFAAPFMETFIELNVELSAESIGSREHYLSKIIDLNEYSQPERAKKFNQQQQQQQQELTENGSDQQSAESSSPQHPCHVSLSNPARRRSLSRRLGNNGSLQRRSNLWNGSSSHSSAFSGMDLEQLPPPPVITLKHGKVLFRIYNSSTHSGYLDLFVAFDTRAEFSAVEYPELLHVPTFMHHIPRGLRSPFMKRCTPRPPSTTRTTGVYVRHTFELGILDYVDPAIISVLQEVHRYSLEDHEGLLIGVGSGGTCFESSFLTLTSALASSICFTQRVLVRLGERVVLSLRCSITEGPLMMAAYQGQYNDADNMRSSYPDVQFVGAVIYASQHPPIAPPYLTAYEEDSGSGYINGRAYHEDDVSTAFAHNKEMSSFTTQGSFDDLKIRSSRSSIIALNNINSNNHINHENCTYNSNNGDNSDNSSFVSLVRNSVIPTNTNYVRFGEKNKKNLTNGSSAMHEAAATTRIRFELRSVAYDKRGEIDLSKGAVCLREDYLKGVYEDIFPYFLNFLREHFDGTRVEQESHALVVIMPLPVIYANVQMSTTLDKSCYKRKKDGVYSERKRS